MGPLKEALPAELPRKHKASVINSREKQLFRQKSQAPENNVISKKGNFRDWEFINVEQKSKSSEEEAETNFGQNKALLSALDGDQIFSLPLPFS